MEERFDEMEEKEMYALATYLDPRYKGFFFQNPENASTAKQKIAEKLKKLLLEDPSFQNVDGQASMNMENESPLGKKPIITWKRSHDSVPKRKYASR